MQQHAGQFQTADYWDFWAEFLSTNYGEAAVKAFHAILEKNAKFESCIHSHTYEKGSVDET